MRKYTISEEYSDIIRMLFEKVSFQQGTKKVGEGSGNNQIT